MNHFNFKLMKSKDFWKKELKTIRINDILIWIAVILMFMASYQNIQAGNDPCSYCIINNHPNYDGPVSCREFFEMGDKITIEPYENITYNNTG